MNPLLQRLQPYPFERLRQLFSTVSPSAKYPPISLGIGEPRHATPQLVLDALAASTEALSSYPATAGLPALRQSCANWVQRRYGLALNPDNQILPINGSREALFAFAQTVVDGSKTGATVVCPNPFYQIYEGAAFLAGAKAFYTPSDPALNFNVDWGKVPDEVWKNTQLLFVCSPGNPTGSVMPLEDWKTLFELSDRYGFVIASDECYSNVPGMRSGFVSGDANLLKKFLLYRTYHGSAMSGMVQAASIAAWDDEVHVVANRDMYRQKFAAVTPVLAKVLDVKLPDAGFYLWAAVPGGDDQAFARDLLAQYNVTVLPGSFLARESQGFNPGAGRIRMALVAETQECMQAAQRIVEFVQHS